jgi:hypothetical protein
MYQALLSFFIHAAGIISGFILCVIFLPKPATIEMLDEILPEYEYVEELEELIDSNAEESPVSKDNVVKVDIINNTVIMFYDPEKEAFCYYTKGDVIHKYLNAVCRKYVIDFNCPSLYKDEASHIVKTEKFGNALFVNKVERTTLEKNINKFILCGTLDEYYKVEPEENDIDIIDFLKLS